MQVITEKIKLNSNGDTDIIDITSEVSSALKGTGLKNGLVTVFVSGSTGGLTTVEYEPGLVADLKKSRLNRGNTNIICDGMTGTDMLT